MKLIKLKAMLKFLDRYKFKLITGLAIILATTILNSIFPCEVFGAIGSVAFWLMILIGIRYYCYGVYNLYKKDGDLASAILFGVVGIGFVGMLIYILFFSKGY
jgi:hypothetical protein